MTVVSDLFIVSTYFVVPLYIYMCSGKSFHSTVSGNVYYFDEPRREYPSVSHVCRHDQDLSSQVGNNWVSNPVIRWRAVVPSHHLNPIRVVFTLLRVNISVCRVIP